MNPNKLSFIKPSKSPVFYGYVVLIVGTIGIFASVPGQTVGVSVFTDPVKDALGLTRNEFSNAYMIGTLLSAFFVIKAGRWFDSFGARYVAFFACSLLAISLLLCSVSVQISTFFKYLFNLESSIVPFVVITFLFFLIRFSGQGVLTMSSRNMIMMWFNKNRGKINSISSVAISLGFSSSPILFNSLIDNNGWELSWQILAICLLIFSFFIIQLYRNKPEDFGLHVDGLKCKIQVEKINKKDKSLTLNEAKKTRAFWMFGLILAFNSFFITGFTFHIISIFSSQEYTKNQAIAIFLPISIIAVFVSIICNILSDYIAHKIYLYIMLFSAVIASLGFIFLGNPFAVYFLIGGLGVLGGLFGVVNAVTMPRYFGRRYLGEISGKVMSFIVIASALAPSLFSYSFTNLNSYSYIGYFNLIFLAFLIIGSFKVEKPK